MGEEYYKNLDGKRRFYNCVIKNPDGTFERQIYNPKILTIETFPFTPPEEGWFVVSSYHTEESIVTKKVCEYGHWFVPSEEERALCPEWVDSMERKHGKRKI